MNVNLEQPGVLAKLPISPEVSEQWQQTLGQVTSILADLPEYLGQFVGKYRQPLTNVGLGVLAVVAVYLTLAVLDAINDVPLLAPTFELIGIGYSIWFTVRYLRLAAGRKELTTELQKLKNQILGQK
jgi:hypothetical protein